MARRIGAAHGGSDPGPGNKNRSTICGAARLRRVIDVQGSGDVYPLASALLGIGQIEFTGRNYHSRKVGRTLVVAEVEPVTGNPSAAFLDGVAAVATWFPSR